MLGCDSFVVVCVCQHLLLVNWGTNFKNVIVSTCVASEPCAGLCGVCRAGLCGVCHLLARCITAPAV